MPTRQKNRYFSFFRRMNKVNMFTLLAFLGVILESYASEKSDSFAFSVQGKEAMATGRIPKGWSIAPEQRDNKNNVKALSTEKKLYIYGLPYEMEVYPYYVPSVEITGKTVSVKMAGNEYEPLLIGAYSQIKQPAMSVEITGLKNEKNELFPSEYFDIRRIKFIPSQKKREDWKKKQLIYIPGPNEKFDKLNLTVWESTFLWINFFAGSNVKPGVYKGRIEFKDGDRIVDSLPLTVEVLPFALSKPERAYGYYMVATPWSGKRPWLRPDAYDKLFALWKEYGMESPSLFMEYSPDGTGYLNLKYDESGKLSADFSQLDRLFGMMKKAGFHSPVALNTGSTLYRFFQKHSDFLKRNHPGKYKSGDQLYGEFNSMLLEHAKVKGWGELMLAGGEEATANPRYFRALREISGATTIWVDNSQYGPGNRHRSMCERWGDRVHVRETNFVSLERTQIAHAAGNLSYFYNGSEGRLQWGFMMEMANADGYHKWAGEWPDIDPLFRLHPSRYCWQVTYASTDGKVLSSQPFEIAREGIDDARYAAKLRALIKSAESAGDIKSAESARKILDSSMKSLPEHSEELHDFLKNKNAALACAANIRSQLIEAIVPLLKYEKVKTVPSIRKSSVVKSVFDVKQDGGFKMPPHFKIAPGNTSKPGFPGFSCINTIDGAEVVYVPSTRVCSGSGMNKGAYLMGSNHGVITEQPVHEVELDGFWIYKNEVTVGQWKKFLAETDYKWGKPEYDSNGKEIIGVAGRVKDSNRAVYMDDGRAWNWAITEYPDNFPVRRVSRLDALAYAKWARVNLPTEAQWEWAGRGPAGFVYPWGNEWNDEEAQFIKGKPSKKLLSVDSWKENRSWCGAVAMTGSLREWCSDDYNAYENFYAKSPRLNPAQNGTLSQPILRGGSSFYGTPFRFRLSGKYYSEWHDIRNELNGFRPSVSQNLRR